MDKIAEIIGKFPDLSRESLIPILQEIQDEYGYLSEEAIERIGKALDLPASKIFGLSTFYNQFHYSKGGKYHICVCHGTNCYMNGSGQLLEELVKLTGIREGETSRDGLFSLEVLSCIGACGQSPVISVNGKYYHEVTKEKLVEIIDYYRHQER